MIIHTEAKKNAGRKVFIFYYWKWLIGIIIAGILIYFGFYYNRSPIQRVVFDQETEQTLSLQEIFDTAENNLIGKSYYKEKHFNRSEFEQDIIKKYPIVQHIQPISFTNGTLTLHIVYHKPDFLMKTENGVQWIVYKNTIIPNNSGNNLGITGIHINIALPEDQLLIYSGGIFRQSPSQHITRTIQQVDFITGFSSVTYYPGWEKLSLEDGKNTFIIGLEPTKIEETFTQWKKIMPYLPTAIPAKVDLSNPDHIIIQH